MNETSSGSGPHDIQKPQIPRAKLWVIGGLFLIAAVGMYAGTMYRIKHYGYVGINNDQPIKKPAAKSN